MALARWQQGNDVLSQLDRMQREMDRLMSGFSQRPGWTGWPTSRVYPPLNIYNDGECFILRAEVPGVDPKSIELDATGDTLTLRGERQLPEIPKGASYHRCERDSGRFRRSFTLPNRVDSSKVVASCQSGILEIRLPHAEEAKARKITVKS